jgi:hypothetical protein
MASATKTTLHCFTVVRETSAAVKSPVLPYITVTYNSNWVRSGLLNGVAVSTQKQ